MYVRISEFSQLLDDHGMFRSIRVINDIHLHLFDVRKARGGREERVRGGDDICLDVNLPKHLLYRSPFSIYFTLSEVGWLGIFDTLLIVTSATFL